MGMYNQEDKLFANWERRVKARGESQFVPDGVVCEEEYSKSELKIVVILKEVNNPGVSDFDLRVFLRDGAPYGAQTWNNIARWVYGIRHRKLMPAWKDFPSMSAEKRAEILQSICAINLKKSPGGSSAIYEELENAVNNDGALIKKQYEFYNPDITICGGTEYFFKKCAGHCDKEWKETSRGCGGMKDLRKNM